MTHNLLRLEIATALQLAAEGKTIMEIATHCGRSYAWAREKLSSQGVKAQRASHVSPAGFERNKNILARRSAGESEAEIAKSLGLTRERVRQIIARQGGEAARSIGAAKIRDRVEKVRALAAEGKLAAEIAKELGCTSDIVRKDVRENGIAIKRPILSVELAADISAAADRVMATNVSILSVVREMGRNSYFNALVQEELKKRGHVLQTGRWNGLAEKRLELILPMLEKGMTYREIAECMARVHGWNTSQRNIMGFVARHGIKVTRERKIVRTVTVARKPKPMQQLSPKKTSDPVVVDGTKPIRENCIALRDKHTASQIAAALGITRNSVIGYWNRNRKREEQVSA